MVQRLILQLLPPIGIPNRINCALGLPCALKTGAPIAHNALVGVALAVLIQPQEGASVHGTAAAANTAPHAAAGTGLHLAACPQTHLDALALPSCGDIGELFSVFGERCIFAQQIHDHLAVAGKVTGSKNDAVFTNKTEVFFFIVVTDQGNHTTGFVLFQIVAGDAIDELRAHIFGKLMGKYHGFGETQGILMRTFRRRTFLTVTLAFSGRGPHFAHVEFGVLENGGAHIVVVAVELTLKMLGPGVLKGHNVLELFGQGVHKPVKGGAGFVGKLPNQCGIGAV